MFKALALTLFFSGLVCKVSATTCSATVNPCMTTLRVTNVCDTTNSDCTCTDTSTYSQIDTGCALTSAFTAPAITSSGASGEVQDTETITLTCEPSTGIVVAGNGYKWYEGGVVQGTTTATHTVTGADGTTVAVTCSYVIDGIESSQSSAFSVLGYTAGAAYELTRTPVITQFPTGGAVTGSTFSVACTNLPTDATVTFAVNDGTTAQTNPYDYTVDGNAPTFTCVLTDTDSLVTMASTPTAATTAGQDASVLLASKTVDITSSTTPITITAGANIAPTCGYTDASDVLFTVASDVAFQWYEGGTASTQTGNNAATLDTSGLTAGTYALTCGITPTSGTETLSTSTLTVTVVAGGSNTDASVVTAPGSIMAGNLMIARCLVHSSTQANLDATTYAWDKDGDTIVGQTDHTLQAYGVSAANHDGIYTCTATGSSISSGSATVAVSAVTTIVPTLTSDLSTTNFGTGNTYVLTCTVSANQPDLGITYTWNADGVAVSGQTASTYTITASTTSVSYTCSATFASTNTQNSVALAVQGQAITGVTLSGASAPVVGTSPVYTCAVTLSSAGGTPTYSIRRDTTELSTTTSHTVSSIALTTSDGAYTCVATVGTDTVTSSAIAVVAVATPATPVVTVPSPLNVGGTYTLTCTSNSIASDTTVTYAWTFGGTAASNTASTWTLESVAAANAGDYTCTITINSVASTASAAGTVTVGSAFGLPCTQANYDTQCTSNFALYTGNCVADRCECVSGVTLSQDFCGDPESGAGAVGVSLFTLSLAVLASLFM